MRRLEFTNVSHRFGETLAVDDVSIGVEAGEFVCLLGPSGSGKTTLLRLAAGLDTLQSGRIAIDGSTVAEGGHAHQIPPEKRGVGLMFQDYALFPHLTVAQNIGFGLQNGLRDGTWIERALGDMHLAHLGERYPHTLSGGQQQRIALLRALAPAPAVSAARRTVFRSGRALEATRPSGNAGDSRRERCHDVDGDPQSGSGDVPCGSDCRAQ